MCLSISFVATNLVYVEKISVHNLGMMRISRCNVLVLEALSCWQSSKIKRKPLAHWEMLASSDNPIVFVLLLCWNFIF